VLGASVNFCDGRGRVDTPSRRKLRCPFSVGASLLDPNWSATWKSCHKLNCGLKLTIEMIRPGDRKKHSEHVLVSLLDEPGWYSVADMLYVQISVFIEPGLRSRVPNFPDASTPVRTLPGIELPARSDQEAAAGELVQLPPFPNDREVVGLGDSVICIEVFFAYCPDAITVHRCNVALIDAKERVDHTSKMELPSPLPLRGGFNDLANASWRTAWQRSHKTNVAIRFELDGLRVIVPIADSAPLWYSVVNEFGPVFMQLKVSASVRGVHERLT
jgi:hypothetical protein